LGDMENNGSDYPLTCEIRNDQSNLVESALMIYWNTDGGDTFTASPLVPAGGDSFEGSIPMQPSGTVVYYYIHGEAENGKATNHPLRAPDDLHSFNVTGDLPPRPTPTPACDLGVKLFMPSHDFGPGNPFSCMVTICNPGPETYTDVPLFAILDVFGTFYFYPTYSDFDYMKISVPQGEFDLDIISEFPWPQDAGTVTDGVFWYSGMTTPEMSELLGEMDSWPFGWHE